MPAARPPAGVARRDAKPNLAQSVVWGLLGLIIGILLGYFLHS